VGAVPAADIPQADIHRMPTAAAVVAAADVAASCAHRHWSCERGCSCGHVSWRCGMMKCGGCRYFRPHQSYDCASKTGLGVAMGEPVSSW